jgi:hypothetical protein
MKKIVNSMIKLEHDAALIVAIFGVVVGSTTGLASIY